MSNHPASGKRIPALATVLLVAAVSGAALAPLARAATFTWSNAAGGNWSTAANWTPSGVPATGDAVTLPALGGAYTVTVDANASIAGLTLGAGATLALATGDSLSFTGRAIANDGALVIGPTAANALFLRDTVEFSGAGSLVLQGSGRVSTPYARPQWRAVIVNGAGHTITGDGDIWAVVVNRGTLLQTGTGSALLTLWANLTNLGTVMVRDGGQINVNCPGFKSYGGQIVGHNGTFSSMMPYGTGANYGTLDNLNGGSFVADGGNLNLNCGTLAGGTVSQINGSGVVQVLVGGNPQNLVVAPGAELGFYGASIYVASAGALENHGTVHLHGTLYVGARDFGTSVSTANDGVISLEGGTLSVADGRTFVNASGSSIVGCGTIEGSFVNEGSVTIDCASGSTDIASSAFVNHGGITVKRGILHVLGAGTQFRNSGTISGGAGGVRIDQGATLVNTGGTLIAGTSNVLLGSKATAASIVGGTLGSINGGVVANYGTATLQDVTIAPAATFYTLTGAVTTATGARVTNLGTNDIRAGGSFIVGGATDYTQTGGVTVLEGGTLNVARGFVVNGELRGTGTVIGSVTNAGVVTPDINATGIGVQGDYHQLAAGRLDIGLSGYAADQFAHLTVSGAAQLDGAVAVAGSAGFVPAAGKNFGVMGAGARAGQFAQIDAGPGLAVVANYGDNGVTLVSTSALAVDGVTLPATLRFYGHSRGFELALPQNATVDVRAFDVAGRMVAVLASGSYAAGIHHLDLGAASLPSGLYFARATVVTAGAREVKLARTIVAR